MKKILIINNEKDMEDLGWIPEIKEAIRGIEEVDFSVIHHSEISDEYVNQINPDLVYLTGRVTYDWTIDEILKDYEQELEFIKNTEIPILGVCAGMQLIGVAYGSNFGKMFETKEDEDAIRETGFQKINLIKSASLLDNLEDEFVCYEFHRDEVKDIPKEFDLLASTEMCKHQAIKHKDKQIYGVQFHPEKYNDENQDGKIILKNFLEMA